MKRIQSFLSNWWSSSSSSHNEQLLLPPPSRAFVLPISLIGQHQKLVQAIQKLNIATPSQQHQQQQQLAPIEVKTEQIGTVFHLFAHGLQTTNLIQLQDLFHDHDLQNVIQSIRVNLLSRRVDPPSVEVVWSPSGIEEIPSKFAHLAQKLMRWEPEPSGGRGASDIQQQQADVRYDMQNTQNEAAWPNNTSTSADKKKETPSKTMDGADLDHMHCILSWVYYALQGDHTPQDLDTSCIRLVDESDFVHYRLRVAGFQVLNLCELQFIVLPFMSTLRAVWIDFRLRNLVIDWDSPRFPARFIWGPAKAMKDLTIAEMTARQPHALPSYVYKGGATVVTEHKTPPTIPALDPPARRRTMGDAMDDDSIGLGRSGRRRSRDEVSEQSKRMKKPLRDDDDFTTF